MPCPLIPLSTLRRQPRDCLRKTRGQVVRYSFPVRLFHPRLHAGLSRRTVRYLFSGALTGWGQGSGKANGWAEKVPDTFLPGGSLFLSCKALSSSTACRFIPAHFLTPSPPFPPFPPVRKSLIVAAPLAFRRQPKKPERHRVANEQFDYCEWQYRQDREPFDDHDRSDRVHCAPSQKERYE